jgi:hypothetical protein
MLQGPIKSRFPAEKSGFKGNPGISDKILEISVPEG